MASGIQIIDVDNVDSIDWPTNKESDHTRRYMVPFIKNGSLFYMDNADVKMMALMIDDVLMPLVLAERNYHDSNVCSTYTHYVKYAVEEIEKLDNRPLAWLLKACSLPFALILKAGRVDKVIYVNNWLFSTNPCPELLPEQVGAITSALKLRYPGYAIVFRSVNTYTCKTIFDSLRENGYRMVRSRQIYILDPTRKAYLKKENVRKDRKLLKKTAYKIIDTDQLTETDVPVLTKLYRDLYLRKHSFFNPQLNENFFHLILKERILEIKALRKSGRIDAFSGCYSNKKVMIFGIGGHDTQVPLKVGLNRQYFSVTMAEAEKRGQLLNLSAGAGTFKLFRGAEPCIEYDAVYDDHLPFHRRLAWWCLKYSLDVWQYAASFLLCKRTVLPTSNRPPG
ncbi:MAG: hypothetical protein JRC90_05145 [Deltaproteobacteria bacterium]|nr:hypothetical protein [Deltaproteobacteria bacterium]